MNNKFCCNLDNRDILKEVIMKIGLEKTDTQEGVIVEALLDSRMMELVMRSEFARKKRFKLKKIERLIYMRNMNSPFKQKEPIKHIVEVNIYYQKHKKKIEIDMIGEQKQSVILGMLQLPCHNYEINWRKGKVKMTGCSKECGKQQRPKQEKSEQ